MSELYFDRKMSDVEGLMWRLEKDPYLTSTFGNVTILDRKPDFDLMRRRFERASIAILVSSALVQVTTGFLNVLNAYPFPWYFTSVHHYLGYVASHNVWGVPTFLVGDRAVFVRLLHTPDGDADLAIGTVERVLEQIDWPILNEFKHTSIPR